jgi:hypothetical protein
VSRRHQDITHIVSIAVHRKLHRNERKQTDKQTLSHVMRFLAMEKHRNNFGISFVAISVFTVS